MKTRMRKAIILFLALWFMVTCYGSLARIKKAYFPSTGWYSPYLENLQKQEEIEQEIGETKELLERVKQGQEVKKPAKTGFSGFYDPWENPYYNEDNLAEDLERLEERKLSLQKIPALDKMAILLRFRRPPGERLRYFYENAHRVVKGELYLLLLLNAIPLSLAGAIFYLLKDEPQNKYNRT